MADDIDFSGFDVHEDDEARVHRLLALIEATNATRFQMLMAAPMLKPQTYRQGSLTVADAEPRGKRQSAVTRIVRAARELERIVLDYRGGTTTAATPEGGERVRPVYPRLLCMDPWQDERVICLQEFKRDGVTLFRPGDRIRIAAVQPKRSDGTVRYVFLAKEGGKDPVRVRQSDMRFRILTPMKTLPQHGFLWDDPQLGDEVEVTAPFTMKTHGNVARHFLPGEKLYVLAVGDVAVGRWGVQDTYQVQVRAANSGVTSWVNALNPSFVVTRRREDMTARKLKQ